MIDGTKLIGVLTLPFFRRYLYQRGGCPGSLRECRQEVTLTQRHFSPFGVLERRWKKERPFLPTLCHPILPMEASSYIYIFTTICNAHTTSLHTSGRNWFVCAFFNRCGPASVIGWMGQLLMQNYQCVPGFLNQDVVYSFVWSYWSLQSILRLLFQLYWLFTYTGDETKMRMNRCYLLQHLIF